MQNFNSQINIQLQLNCWRGQTEVAAALLTQLKEINKMLAGYPVIDQRPKHTALYFMNIFKAFGIRLQAFTGILVYLRK